EKLDREKELERWTYLVAKSGLEPLLRDCAGLMPEKKKDAKKTEGRAHAAQRQHVHRHRRRLGPRRGNRQDARRSRRERRPRRPSGRQGRSAREAARV